MSHPKTARLEKLGSHATPHVIIQLIVFRIQWSGFISCKPAEGLNETIRIKAYMAAMLWPNGDFFNQI